jgi:hypothetical protein
MGNNKYFSYMLGPDSLSVFLFDVSCQSGPCKIELVTAPKTERCPIFAGNWGGSGDAVHHICCFAGRSGLSELTRREAAAVIPRYLLDGVPSYWSCFRL